jgi:predicted Rossmann fold nucleotide-binding protein DprA/Smf involved in DNA uptake
MSDQKKETQSRGETLKRLREAHATTVEQTQILLREQKRMQSAICQFIRDTPKTIPEIATEIDQPPHEVLWFVAALKKYGIVVEAGMCGDYPLYQRAKEVQA